MSRTLRCYAYRTDRVWEAICVDFDIATFGDSLDAVKESLVTCIELYLEEIEELPATEQRRFLTRRAPWHVRARLAVMTRLGGLRCNTRRSLQFALRVANPMPP